MPEPRKGESKGAYIKRCVSIVHGEEGVPMRQALGKCYGMWRYYKAKQLKNKR